MGQPNWEIVARAVCSMEGMSQGLKNKALARYIDENFQNRIPVLKESYSEWIHHQAKFK